MRHARRSSAAAGLVPVGSPREVESHRVTQHVLSGAEILRTVDWAGSYIPIVPVYGDEVVDGDGKRHFRSLIRDAKSAQQMFNYWRTTTTELVALAPKAPFIGEERAFELDPNWSTANSQSHPYLMVPTGAAIPQRQPFSGVPAGAMQEALNASDDMKAIIGIYDASLGARWNETSGRAIMARQREGDVSTFHFIDNLSRAIRHGGRILIDLIPKVYTTERMIRVLGSGQALRPGSGLAGPGQEMSQTVRIAPTGRPVSAAEGADAVYDLAVGKYDLTVAAGPSYTTRREEVTAILTEVMRSVPDSAVFLAGRLARLLDLPDAEELGREMDMLNPAKRTEPTDEGDPELRTSVQQLRQQLAAAAAALRQAQNKVTDKEADRQLDAQKLGIDLFRAQTERMKAEAQVRSGSSAAGLPE